MGRLFSLSSWDAGPEAGSAGPTWGSEGARQAQPWGLLQGVCEPPGPPAVWVLTFSRQSLHSGGSLQPWTVVCLGRGPPSTQTGQGSGAVPLPNPCSPESGVWWGDSLSLKARISEKMVQGAKPSASWFRRAVRGGTRRLSGTATRPLPSGWTGLHNVFPVSGVGAQRGSRRLSWRLLARLAVPRRGLQTCGRVRQPPARRPRKSSPRGESEARGGRVYHPVLRSRRLGGV